MSDERDSVAGGRDLSVRDGFGEGVDHPVEERGEGERDESVEAPCMLEVDAILEHDPNPDYWCISDFDGVYTKLGVWSDGTVDLFVDTNRYSYPQRWRDAMPDVTIDVSGAHLGTLSELLRDRPAQDVIAAFRPEPKPEPSFVWPPTPRRTGWQKLIGTNVQFATRRRHIERHAAWLERSDTRESLRALIDSLTLGGLDDDVVDIGPEVLGEDESLYTPRWVAVAYFESLLDQLPEPRN